MVYEYQQQSTHQMVDPALDDLDLCEVGEEEETLKPLLQNDKRRQSLASTLSFSSSGVSPRHTLQPIDNSAIPSLSVPQSPGVNSVVSSWSENLTPWPSPKKVTTDKDAISSSNSLSNVSSNLSTRMRDLVRAFSSRTQRVKEKTTQPPTPSSTCSSVGEQSLSCIAILCCNNRQKSMPQQSHEGRKYSMDNIPFLAKSPPKLLLVRALTLYRAVFVGCGVYENILSNIRQPTELLVSMGTLSSDKPANRLRLDSILGGGSDCPSEKEEVWCHIGKCRIRIPTCVYNMRMPSYIQPQSKLYLTWLFIVTIAFLYNAYGIPLRGVFPYQTESNLYYWLTIDYICDAIYLIDILLFKSRITFIDGGLQVTSKKVMFLHYKRKLMFKMDLASLTPLDFLYFVQNDFNVWYRLPRLLKIQSFWEFFDRVDQEARSGHILRVVRTMSYMIFLIHLETCGYYAFSRWEGINTNRWVYNGQGIAYIRCFYLATKTATSIGNNPKPTNILEYSFMIVYWLSGVFVFALLVGQIRNIFEAASAVETNYTKTRDLTIAYMKSIDIPPDIQNRVKMWFDHNWRQQKTLDETSLYSSLPRKLQIDMAVSVHYETLSKVQLFQDCDKNLLYDLLLKLIAVLFLPGDYICRKGEVGKEMYIVSNGQVEVVGGPNNEMVFATLHAGSVFGEISLLALSGGNRRTADVRSKGFTNVFILSKKDFEDAMNDYPEAQKLLKKRAKKLLSENAARERETKKDENVEEIIKTPRSTPKLLKTVLKVMNKDSETMNRLSVCRSTAPDLPDIALPTESNPTKECESFVANHDFGSQFSLSDLPNDTSDGDSLSSMTLSPPVFHPDHPQARSVSQIGHSNPLPDPVTKSLTDFNSEKTIIKREVNSISPNQRPKKQSYTSEFSSSDGGLDPNHLGSRPKSSLKRRPRGSARSNKSVTFSPPHKVPLSPQNKVADQAMSNHVAHSPPRRDIPAENQITCSVDVHREKSRTPSSTYPDDISRQVTNSALSWLFSMDNVRETLC